MRMGEAVLSGFRWGGAMPALWLMQQKDSVGALWCCEHFWVTDGVASGSLPNTALRCPSILFMNGGWQDLMAPRPNTLKRLWGLL